MKALGGGLYEANKIDLIKLVREASTMNGAQPAMGLKESKEAVEEFIMSQAYPEMQRALGIIRGALVDGGFSKKWVAKQLDIQPFDM